MFSIHCCVESPLHVHKAPSTQCLLLSDSFVFTAHFPKRSVQGFWRNTSCLVHLALDWHASKREECTLHVCVFTHCFTTAFLISLSTGCIPSAITLANERKASSNYHRHERTFIGILSFQSLSLFSLLLFASSVQLDKISPCSERDGDPEILNRGEKPCCSL